MKICVLFGSPRRNGATERLLRSFLRFFPEAETTVIRASERLVAPCTGCEACRETGVCVIRDDMDAVNRAIDGSDLLVLASPIYYSNFPAPLKSIVDRSLPYFWDSLRRPAAVRKGLVLATAGSSYEGDLVCFERTARVFFLTRQTRFLGLFPVTGTDGEPEQQIFDSTAQAAYNAVISE